MEKRKHLANIYKEEVERERRKLSVFTSGKKSNIIGSLFGLNKNYALHALFILRDEKKARHHFYTMARIGLYQFYQDSIPIENWQKMFYALLSDHDPTIQNYMQLGLVSDRLKGRGQFMLSEIYQAIRAAWTNDTHLMERSIIGIQKAAEKAAEEPSGDDYFSAYLPFADVFTGIANQNNETIEAGIYQLLTKHSKIEENGLVQKFMSVEATTMTKLALRLGFSAQIDSPLIPEILLPYEPLENPKSYDFLDDESIFNI